MYVCIFISVDGYRYVYIHVCMSASLVEREFLFVTARSALEWASARSQELNVSLPLEWQGPSHLSIYLPFPRICTHRKLESRTGAGPHTQVLQCLSSTLTIVLALT